MEKVGRQGEEEGGMGQDGGDRKEIRRFLGKELRDGDMGQERRDINMFMRLGVWNWVGGVIWVGWEDRGMEKKEKEEKNKVRSKG